MTGWEKADGRAEVGEWSVVYALYVNPVRRGLYEVTRFRVARETEKLLWNARPGSREPLVCYEWSGRRSWRTLWIRRWTWRRLLPGTEQYRAARRLMALWAVYACSSTGPPGPPAPGGGDPEPGEPAEDPEYDLGGMTRRAYRRRPGFQGTSSSAAPPF